MTKDEIKNLLKKYTPTFIVDNDVFDAIYDAIASSILTIDSAITSLKDANWTGKGLIKNAELNQVVFREDDAENTIQTKLTNRFTRHPLVGSEDQILTDVRDITGDQTATIDFFGPTQCGLIVDVTYIGVDVQAIVDVNKLIQVNISSSEIVYSDIDIVKPTIRERLVPIDIEIIYNLT